MVTKGGGKERKKVKLLSCVRLLSREGKGREINQDFDNSKCKLLYVKQINYKVVGFAGGSVGKESPCKAGDTSSIPGSERSPGEGIGYPLQYSWASLVAQVVKNPPAMQETWVQSLGWEDPLEKGIATHSIFLAWRIPRTEEPGRYSPWGCKETDTTEQLHLQQGPIVEHMGLYSIFCNKP